MYKLYERIEGLCKMEGKSITQMCNECDIARASLTDLKKGRKKTLSAQTLSKIAAYFGVSVDYLLGVVDEYGLTESDWKLMGRVYKERREKADIEAKDACDGDVIDHSHLVGFELLGLRLTLQQLDVICGMIGTTAPDVFALWADKLWGKKENPTNIDKDALEYAQAVHDRPELKTLFKIGRNATPEKLGAILALLEDRNEN